MISQNLDQLENNPSAKQQLTIWSHQLRSEFDLNLILLCAAQAKGQGVQLGYPHCFADGLYAVAATEGGKGDRANGWG